MSMQQPQKPNIFEIAWYVLWGLLIGGFLGPATLAAVIAFIEWRDPLLVLSELSWTFLVFGFFGAWVGYWAVREP